MKKFIAVRLMLATVFVMLMSGCSTTAEKINSLIDDTLNNSEELTPEEWQQRDSLLEELMNEYEANKEAYTPEEQAQIDQALGKYFGAQGSLDFLKVLWKVSGLRLIPLNNM